MNDIEKAILALRFIKNNLIKNIRTENGRKSILDGIKLAIEALEEKQEREKECEVCKDVISIYRYKVASKFKNDSLADLLMDEKANFCPKCGRKLGDE